MHLDKIQLFKLNLFPKQLVKMSNGEWETKNMLRPNTFVDWITAHLLRKHMPS